MAYKQKILWFDTETTDVDPVHSGIIQNAGLVEIDGEVVEEFNITSRPHPNDAISDKAIETHGISKEEMMSYQDATIAYFQLKRIFDKYVNKFNSQDKFICGGKNIQFDKAMLNWFFRKNGAPHPRAQCIGDPYLFSYLSPADFDAQHLAVMLEMKRQEKVFSDYKLQTLCDTMNVELLGAHDAMADIYATREVALIMWEEISQN